MISFVVPAYNEERLLGRTIWALNRAGQALGEPFPPYAVSRTPTNRMPKLFIFAGLPGSGKTTLARQLARRLNAVYLRIDTIEQKLRDLCKVKVEGEGYRLAYGIAADNLQVGTDVVADSCNPIELTRREWEDVATANGATFVNIEVICSDTDEHRLRFESRVADVPGLTLPTWAEVENREYQDWSRERIIIDTAKRPVDACFDSLVDELDTAIRTPR